MSENKEVNEDISKNTHGQEEIGRGSDSISETNSSEHNVFDPLGLLTRSKYIAVAAADAAAECSLEKKRKPKHLEAASEVEEETRRKRLEANRKSAAESRKRKKILIEELQQTVKYLTEENEMLKRENAMLKMNQGKPSSQSIGIDNTNNNIASLGDVAVLSGSDQQQPFLPIPSFQGNFSYTLPNADMNTQEILLQHQQQLLNNLNTTNSMAMSADHYSSSNLLRNFQEQNRNIGVFHPPQSNFDEMTEQNRDKEKES